MTLVKGIAMVRIPGKRYEIGKYDVTKAEWIAVMGSYQSDGRCYGDTCPVENVNWNEVQEFIKKLNAKTGKKYRLPTEAEWEYACYGGNKTEYCGGGNIDSVEWARVNQDKFPHSIGGKRVNKFGIYDMYDNVWQWMSDCWSADCTARVLRGGPKDISHPERSASYRSGFGLTYSDANIGFRLARTLP
jgi:formylglycine-generating enzyme required for sulfatase activity